MLEEPLLRVDDAMTALAKAVPPIPPRELVDRSEFSTVPLARSPPNQANALFCGALTASLVAPASLANRACASSAARCACTNSSSISAEYCEEGAFSPAEEAESSRATAPNLLCS